MSEFTPITDIDPNVWYQLSEARVDEYTDRFFTSNLQVSNSTTGEVNVWPDNGHVWQFQPLDPDDSPGRYFLRSSVTGVKKQLSVCWHADEISNGKTRPCLQDSDGSDLQQWDVASWGDEEGGRSGGETFRFVNVQNGSDYWLDVHRGNPPFLSDETDEDVYQPAQRWLFSSVSDVDDGGFSTVFTNLPRTESPDTTTTGTTDATTSETSAPTNDSNTDPNSGNDHDDNSGGGLSAGAAAGIGVGAGLAVILLAALAFFFWRRRRTSPNGVPSGAAAPGSSDSSAPVEIDMGAAKWSGQSPYAQSTYSPPPQQLDSQQHMVPPPAPAPAYQYDPAMEMPGDSGLRHELGDHR